MKKEDKDLQLIEILIPADGLEGTDICTLGISFFTGLFFLF